MKIDTQTGN